MLWDDPEGLIQEVQFAIDELAGATLVVLRVLASLEGLKLLKDASSPELHCNLPRSEAVIADDAALREEVADRPRFPRLAKLRKSSLRRLRMIGVVEHDLFLV